jgi:D,D-heptose 1,7-bisphosphate phosphatase
MKRAVFIDKDGTLVKDVPYNVDPAFISFEEGVGDGLRILQENDFLLVIISNQSGIAHGYFTEREFKVARDAIIDRLKKQKIILDGFYYCPHHPEAVHLEYSMICMCRKPQPGMLLQAARDLDIDCGASWMIGDILDDVEAGNRARCKTVLINNGNETEWMLSTQRTPDHIAGNFFEAVLFILNNSAKQIRKHEVQLG